MKLRYKGKIKKIEHIIISDPTYDESVTCRYEKNNLNEENWSVDIDIKPTVEKIENFTIKGTEFFLFLYKDKRLSELKENGTISYLKGIKLEETREEEILEISSGKLELSREHFSQRWAQ